MTRAPVRPRRPHGRSPVSLPVPAELTAGSWRRAGRAMIAKMLGEFAYEELLRPAAEGGGAYRVDLPGGVTYRFRARRGAFGHWRVRAGSVRRYAVGAPGGGEAEEATDPLQLVLDGHEALGLSGDTAGHLVRELTATLIADTRLLSSGRSAAELADLPYAELEGHQSGHPWIVPNKGRMGFAASDAVRYAPEARRPVRLPWAAVHRSLAAYRAVDGLPAARLLAQELDAGTRRRFTDTLAGRGLAAGDYRWLPIHPWQWDEVVVPLFAGDVAAQRIVPLGEAPDRHLAQQSIRTFTNVDTPYRRHVKLPLSVLNTLVWRGLPTDRTLAAPAVTSWVLGIRDADPFLRDDTRVVLLGEVASVTVRHPVLEELRGVPYQYRELLGAIWREPIAAALDPGERARTLAALLHVDGSGRALVTELVERSGLAAREWLRRLFAVMLPPLLHFLYRYGVVFSPHGENAIIVFDASEAPSRLAVKDFVDDVNVSGKPLPELQGMPPDVSAVLLREPPGFLPQFIQSGLFAGVYRYLAPLAADHLMVPESDFWSMVRAEVLAYQRRFPDLAERFGWFELLAPQLDRLCLNRNRLLLDGYRDLPERPHAAVHGRVPNPLSGRHPP
ncbi:MAG: IucA/IucC family protein [Streptomycetales bacterium]